MSGSENSATWVGLIRGIGPNTHKVMPLKELVDRCQAAGFGQVSSVLATGNLVFRSAEPETKLRRTLDEIVRSYGLTNEVFLRRPDQLQTVIAGNPNATAAAERPNHLLVLFLNESVAAEAAERLCGYEGPERIEVAGREIYIDYREGVGRSKLTPVLLERTLGQPGTARNWNTVAKLLRLSSDLETAST